jgi:hypothetical protein
MPPTSITVKGLKGLSAAMNEFSQALGNQVAERSINSVAAFARQDLEVDTPVRAGRLLHSTTVQKQGPTRQTLGQSAPYAAIVNERRQHWKNAIATAQEFHQLYIQEAEKEWKAIVQKHAGQ